MLYAPEVTLEMPSSARPMFLLIQSRHSGYTLS